MRIISISIISIAFLFLNACSDPTPESVSINDQILAKSNFNSEWLRQGIGPDEWYYRMTVIDAPANTQAMGIAEGHWLHPELIRFEITKDMLIGWRSFASVLNAEHEFHQGMQRHYKGAPVVAFAITAHLNDQTDDPSERFESNSSTPWYDRPYVKVDWSKNLVGQLKRNDADEGIISASMNNEATHLVDDSFVGNPKRSRFANDSIEFVTRHPIAVSMGAATGAYGRAFREDTAAPVIDIRHFFLRKRESDFVPLSYPDFVIAANPNGSQPKEIAINKRFGFFRTNHDGRQIYDPNTGVLGAENLVNATIFNIWQKSIDEDGRVIPMEDREVKQVIYYTNVLHPENLMASSTRVVAEWDRAFRNAVFHAQSAQNSSLFDVPQVLLLRRNSCNLDNVRQWLTTLREDLKELVETNSNVALSSVERQLASSLKTSDLTFSERMAIEIRAKRELEILCTALEYYTKDSDEKFVYQRAGDLRFNLLNLEMENNTTNWSGYGPMLSDPITGETISATTNINMKYIDVRSQEMAKQIGLLRSQMPGLEAVFGTGVKGSSAFGHRKLIDERALSTIHERYREVSREDVNPSEWKARIDRSFDPNFLKGISHQELMSLRNAQNNLRNSLVPRASNQLMPTSSAFSPLELRENAFKPKDVSALMDPARFVDDISIGIALKYANLSEHDRFIKIREAIYEAVTLHEIGHNVGLRHNMAGASDALNYGDRFWWTEQLPSSLTDAKKVISDSGMLAEIQRCIDNLGQMKGLSDAPITTQDCLQQKNGMYSSIMDYHATSLAGNQGLGLYDKAAIKWAYAQMVEVFPTENLLVNPESVDLSRWLKLNNYRHIPKAMMRNFAFINQRKHQKFLWDDVKAYSELPNNSVPYAYCDDPSGQVGPRCLAFDFGPDMRSSALWLRSRYWQQYLLNHFAKDSLWGTSQGMQPVASDIEILNRFTNMMRWYYRYMQDDPGFKGSYAEQDYLSALAIGMNHFAQVIGLPEPGPHVSAPNWTIDVRKSFPINANRLEAAQLMIPFNTLETCSAKSITSFDNTGSIEGRFTYKYASIPLGMGRPMFHRFSGNIEDNFVLYSGSSLVKKYALYLLMAPLAPERSSETIEKSDLLAMTWYRMFPEAVSKIYAAVIGQHYEELGPLLAQNNQVSARNIVDETSLKLVDHQNVPSFLPAMDESLPIFAAENAIAFIPKTINQESNLIKSLKITCRDCRDDIDFADATGGANIARYTHLSGHEYKAARFTDMVSIGADLLDQANRQKQRFQQLNDCVDNETIRHNDPFCKCVKVMERKAFNEWVCCDGNNADCSEPKLEAVGDGVCTLDELRKRRDQSKDQLDVIIGFVDALRRLINQAEM